jgi:tetratricopeptide (TPR) repeat protein
MPQFFSLKKMENAIGGDGMITIFKSTRNFYFSCATIGTICWFFILSYVADILQIKSPIFPFISFLWIICTWFFCTVIANRRYSKIKSFLEEGCDPIQFIQLYQKEIESLIHKRNVDRSVKISVFTSLSTAYILIGDYLEAEKMLSEVSTLLNKKTKPILKFSYVINRFSLYFAKDDFLEAEQYLEQIKTIIEENKLPPSFNEKVSNSFHKMVGELEIAKGNDKDYEIFFADAIENATSPHFRVALKYALGRLYLQHNEPTKAQKEFEYVILYGGSTVYKEKALEFFVERDIQKPEVITEAKRTTYPLSARKEKAAMVLFFSAPFFFAILTIALSLIYVGIHYGWGFDGITQYFDARHQESLVFRPTLEEAFAESNEVDLTMENILFIDEHESSVTVFHECNEQFYLTFFVRKKETYEVLYAWAFTRGGGWTINLSENENAPTSYIPFETFIRLNAPIIPHRLPLSLNEHIHRMPLYGFANDDKIHSLIIDGQPANFIIPIGTNEIGEPLFFWYFADIPAFHQQDFNIEDFEVLIANHYEDMEGPSADFSDAIRFDFSPEEYTDQSLFDNIFSILALGVVGFIVLRHIKRKRNKSSKGLNNGK